MRPSLDFTGQVVLVTGGTKGVGRGIAARFADAGATVVTCGRTLPSDPAPDAGAGAGAGATRAGSIEHLACDVRDASQVGALVDAIVARHGRLDVAVNNAGGSPPVPAEEASPRFSEAIIGLNLIGALHVCGAANRVMQGQLEGGAIVNVCSLSGRRPSPATAAYGAAKAGLRNLTETLAMEWAPRVRVNAVTPGPVRTEQSALFYGDDDGIARVAATIPMGRLAEPEDVGDACLFLASPLAAYVSGAELLVHGGGERPPYLDAAAHAAATHAAGAAGDKAHAGAAGDRGTVPTIQEAR
ncbi:MAG: SDR family oxidoreductase [Actinobacteria bacterium]|nr:SDR family oxidoreductase [Actinomycetota bacterium]